MLHLVDLVFFDPLILRNVFFLDRTLLKPFFVPEPLGIPKFESSNKSTLWPSFCNNCENLLQACDHKHHTYYNQGILLFAFHQSCFFKSQSNCNIVLCQANTFTRERLVNNVKISIKLNVKLFVHENLWRRILTKYFK